MESDIERLSKVSSKAFQRLLNVSNSPIDKCTHRPWWST
jgi:hypothetical protein